MSLSTFLNGRPPTRGVMWLAQSDTAVIQTPSVTSDGGGGGTTAWVSAGTVPCRVYPVSIKGKGALVGGQINERSTHFLSMPPLTAINTMDRVVISGRGTFEITFALERTAAFTTLVECVLV